MGGQGGREEEPKALNPKPKNPKPETLNNINPKQNKP